MRIDSGGPKHILLLVQTMQHVGGTQKMVDAISRLLSSEGYQVSQATLDMPASSRYYESSIPCYRLGPIPRLPLVLRPYAYAVAAWRLHQLKRTRGVDVCISNLWGADLINILSGGEDCKISLCHSNVVGNPVNSLLLRLGWLASQVYRRFHRVIAVNPILAVELRELYGLRQSRSGYIPNFVDRPQVLSELPIDNIRRFVWCGRFVYEKNVEGLLHVWRKFASKQSRVQLLLVGDGPRRSSLEELARNLDLRVGSSLTENSAQVLFLGMKADPGAYMLGARAFLLSSRSEGLPMVILEALSLGTPVLAADGPSGGERTALIGYGEANPNRQDTEFSIAGALLPVPNGIDPVRLDLWCRCLELSLDDEKTREWRAGAFERARFFNSAAASRKWREEISLALEEL